MKLLHQNILLGVDSFPHRRIQHAFLPSPISHEGAQPVPQNTSA
jgi:hypothetical protein